MRANKRLELEDGDPQNCQDGDTTNQDTTKTPAVTCPIKPKAGRCMTRTALGLLAERFAELVGRATDRVLDLNTVSQALNTPKRRIYDITSVLQGIELIEKPSKNQIKWLGAPPIARINADLRALLQEEMKLDELIHNCTLQVGQLYEDRNIQRYAYLTYEDIHKIPCLKEQTVIVIRAPAETKLEVPHPEESLQVYLRSTQGPIDVFVCSDESVPMETMDSSADTLASGSHLNSTSSGDSSDLSFSSLAKMSSKASSNSRCGISSSSSPLSILTQHSTTTVTPATPTPTSFQPDSEDQPNFVILTPPLAFSPDGEKYLLSLAEDEGITDLFSSPDLDHSPQDMLHS